MLRDLDPRRSLIAGIIWLMVALAASFAIAASLWAGSAAREIVVQQHERRLDLETQQLASDLGQSISARLEAIRFAGPAPAAQLFERLTHTHPDLGWIAIADTTGTVLAGASDATPNVAQRAWFTHGQKGLWIGAVDESVYSGDAPFLGDMAAPLRDATGRLVGVVAAHLTWPWSSGGVQHLSKVLNPQGSAQYLVVADADAHADGSAAAAAPSAPYFQRLPDGQTALVARSAVKILDSSGTGGWHVQLSEPKEFVYQRANALAERIWWISLCLGGATALLGALGARHLTNRLKNLTRSATAVGRNESARIEVPRGHDEVAQLAGAFAKILDDLRSERTELLNMSTELERRVAVRTREVQRLAEESRYAAIVRERLQIARDLHDTLAHSMMAMLSEIRLLRKLQERDPAALPDELARAEEVAHEGLNEARSAINQMRGNSVRDTGVGPAIAAAVERFKDRTGLAVDISIGADAARFGDERAEVIFRMTEEILRNIERHAGASSVRLNLATDGALLTLSVADDGIGFDPSALRPGHFGLVGLEEQAQLIGAELTIQSTQDQGTVVRVALRVAPETL
jgi:signal transduction histidine kinase